MKSKLNFFFLCWRKKRLFLMEWRGCRSNKRNKFLLIYAFASRLWLIRPTSPTKQLFSSSFILSLMGCFCLLVLNEERARLLKWSWMEFNEAEWSRGRGAAAHNPANLKKTSSPPFISSINWRAVRTPSIDWISFSLLPRSVSCLGRHSQTKTLYE